MEVRYKIGIAVLITVNVILIYLAFGSLLFDAQYLLVNQYDGLKNYFTIQSYINDTNQNTFFYQWMNYPYGDYIFYSDNIPIVSAFLKKCSHWFGYQFQMNHLHIILALNILSTAILSYYFLLRLKLKNSIAFLFAMNIAWINPMINRLNVGHFSLSFSCLYVLAIILLYGFYRADQKKNNRKRILYSALLSLLLFIAGMFHIYYVATIGIAVACFGFFYFFGNRIINKKFSTITLLPTASAVVGLIVTVLFIKITDDYYDLRLAKAEGYGFDDWKLQFKSLFVSYKVFSQQFLLFENKNLPYETQNYLGSAGLYVALFVICYFTLQMKRLRLWMKEEKTITLFILVLFMTGFISVMTGMGNQIDFFGLFKVDNIINPLYYLKLVTERVTQFRCLGRFGWIFFFAFNITVAFLLSSILKRQSRKLEFLAVLIVGILMTIEIGNRVNFQSNNARLNPFHQEQLDYLPIFEQAQFDAILPVPFFHVGSENYNYTIDDKDNWSSVVFQHMLKYQKPTLACKMSRVPDLYAKRAFSIFDNNPIDEEYLDNLSGKKILVLHSKNEPRLNNKEPAKSVIESFNTFITKYKMDSLGTFNEISYFLLSTDKLKEQLH